MSLKPLRTSCGLWVDAVSSHAVFAAFLKNSVTKYLTKTTYFFVFVLFFAFVFWDRVSKSNLQSFILDQELKGYIQSIMTVGHGDLYTQHLNKLGIQRHLKVTSRHYEWALLRDLKIKPNFQRQQRDELSAGIFLGSPHLCAAQTRGAAFPSLHLMLWMCVPVTSLIRFTLQTASVSLCLPRGKKTSLTFVNRYSLPSVTLLSTSSVAPL